MRGETVLEPVELNELAFAKADSKVLSAQSPKTWNYEGRVKAESFYLPWRKQESSRPQSLFRFQALKDLSSSDT
jgi:hypothetical protein